MSPLQKFERQLLKNYLIGSFVAVFGVGCLFIFETLTFDVRERVVLLTIMTISVITMFSFEYTVYKKHMRPLYQVFQNAFPSQEQLTAAFGRPTASLC